jgi:hypothetical protein
MSRIIRPTNKVVIFDPEIGGMREADTTDQEVMERRAKEKNPESKPVKKKKKPKGK